MLTRIDLEDWKSFGSGDSARRGFELAPVTLLVGPNGSGKSNVLDALRFLQGAALDLPLSDVLRGRWEGQREVWPAVRGHVAEAARFGTKEFGIACTWMLAGASLDHGITVETTPDVALTGEFLRKGARYWFNMPRGTARLKGGGIHVTLQAKGKSPNVFDTYGSTRSLLGQIEVRDRVAPAVVDRAHAVRDALRGAVFLDIRPEKMRDYRPENGGHLGTSGENVSPVLSALGDERRQDVVDWLNELCAPEVERVEFDRTQLREVMMFLVERGDRKVSARSISDGTLRFLGHVVALLTCPEDSLMVLEEPDVGLHPSRVRLLAELLEDVAKRRRVQVLATTHSPALLAHLSRGALGAVVAFGRDRDTGTTICSRLRDLPDFETLASAPNLEHLISTGWVERAL
jgi:predicted ATPase